MFDPHYDGGMSIPFRAEHEVIVDGYDRGQICGVDCPERRPKVKVLGRLVSEVSKSGTLVVDMVIIYPRILLVSVEIRASVKA